MLCMKDKSKQEKIDYICESNQISITTLKRLFDLTYPQAEMIIKELLNIHAISMENNIYNIISTTILKDYLSKKI